MPRTPRVVTAFTSPAGDTLYLTRTDGTAFATATVTKSRGTTAANSAVVSGALAPNYDHAVTPFPVLGAGSLSEADDTWTISVAGTTVTTPALAAGRTIAQVAQALSDALAGKGFVVSVSGNALKITKDGQALTIDPVVQFRPNPATFNGTTFPTAGLITLGTTTKTTHFDTVQIGLKSSEGANDYVAGEKWEITIDGRKYEYVVPNNTPVGGRTLLAVAQGIEAVVNGTAATSATYRATAAQDSTTASR